MRRLLVVSAIVMGFACGDNLHPVADARDARDAQSDGPTPDACVAVAPRPALESLTSGDLVIDATQSTNTAPIVAPSDRSVLFVSMNEDEPSPKFGAVICDLHDVDQPVVGTPAGVTCLRSDVGTDEPSSTGEIHVHWSVVTFSTGVAVQRGDVDTTATNPTLVTLTPAVDPAQTFVLVGGNFNGGTGWGNNEFVRAQLLDGGTLDVRTNAAGTHISWQVVTMLGASVQRGTASFATTDVQQQVTTSPAPAGSMVLASYNTDNASGIAAATLMLRASLDTANTLTFERDLGGSALDISWEVATLPFDAYSGTSSFDVAESMRTETAPGVMASTSIAVASNQAILGQSSGSTTYAGADLDLVGEAAFTLTTTPGGLALQRATSQATASIAWTVIDFSRDQCGGM